MKWFLPLSILLGTSPLSTVTHLILIKHGTCKVHVPLHSLHQTLRLSHSARRGVRQPVHASQLSEKQAKSRRYSPRNKALLHRNGKVPYTVRLPHVNHQCLYLSCKFDTFVGAAELPSRHRARSSILAFYVVNTALLIPLSPDTLFNLLPFIFCHQNLAWGTFSTSNPPNCEQNRPSASLNKRLLITEYLPNNAYIPRFIENYTDLDLRSFSKKWPDYELGLVRFTILYVIVKVWDEPPNREIRTALSTIFTSCYCHVQIQRNKAGVRCE